jgi:hypothetical protein
MKRLFIILAISLMTTTGFAAKDEHAGHDHEPAHSNEGEAHDLGHVMLGDITYEVTLHGEITPGAEAVISIEAHQDQSPKELRVWIGKKNGRGSVKSLLSGDSHGHFHGHLEVPAKLAHGSAVWIDARTEAGRERGSVAIPEGEHADHKH